MVRPPANPVAQPSSGGNTCNGTGGGREGRRTKVEWKIVPLTALCASADDIKCGPFGTQLNKDEFREAGVPLWGIKQVNVGFAIPTKEYLEPRTAKRLQQYNLMPGDIVMTRKGTVGNCAVYPDHFEV